MIRRLLLALLVFCLAIPAMAAPLHCLPQPAQTITLHHAHHGEQRQAPSPAAQGHDCIGCIAPYAGLPPMLATQLPPAKQAKPLPAAWTMGYHGGPETPPPRT